jgi:predicted DNA binding protein
VNTVVKSGRRDGWREVLIRQGFGSLCAVPLSYNGTTYGVLTILAEEPETFADQDMEVVSQLGTSIGYAITALERQRALESDDTVELQFEGSESEIPFAQLAADAGCIVQHERTVYRQDDRVSVYYRLQEHNVTDPESIAEQVFTGTVSLISDSDSETMIERTGGSWFGSLISEYGGILRDGIATESSVTLSIEVPQEGDIRTIVEQLTAEYQSLELTAKRQHTDAQPTPRAVRSQLKRELTDRQYEALETGYAMGYFEWPRRSSGEEIADQLGITQPTVNKHIRLGESRLFDLLFDPNS